MEFIKNNNSVIVNTPAIVYFKYAEKWSWGRGRTKYGSVNINQFCQNNETPNQVLQKLTKYLIDHNINRYSSDFQGIDLAILDSKPENIAPKCKTSITLKELSLLERDKVETVNN